MRSPLSCLTPLVLTCAVVTAASGQTRPPLDSLLARAARDSLDATSQYELGLGLLRARRYDEAERAFRDAARRDPRHASARLGIAVVQDRNRDYWRALRRSGNSCAFSNRGDA